MKKTLVLIFLIISFVSHAQMQGGNKDMMKALKDIKARVYGKLIDSKTKKPVEFSSVVVLWFNKDSIMGGTLTKENGEFEIENLPAMGGFRLRVTQIGYKTFETKFYLQPPNKIDLDLGDLSIETDDKLLNEVEVSAVKSTVNLSIDKRTYNVDKDFSVKGGTAADVMKNVPGVTVDGEGNAQLRNQSPTIFVDGRPSNLTLQQIPSDQIDRVEVITNPSVKYDANASAGILNIVMKKNLKPGYNGVVMANGGTGDRLGGMINLNVKEGRWNVSGTYNYNQALNVPVGYTKRTQLDSGKILGYYFQNNKTSSRSQFQFGRMGIDYNINNRNMLSLNGMMMDGRFVNSDKQLFSVQDSNKTEFLNGTQINNQNVHFNNYNLQLQYKKSYPKPGKEFTADANYNYSESDNGFIFSIYNFVNSGTVSIPSTYQKNTGHSSANQYVFQCDFVNPLAENKKIETGMKSYLKESLSRNSNSLATLTEENYEKDDAQSNRYLISDMVNAAYVNYNSKTIWNISYQAGLRFEQSLYVGNITDKNQKFSYNYPLRPEDIMKSLFPGIYLSKKFSNGSEFQINFGRKINRPNFFQLMPFKMFADRQNYRIGNPQLKPEFRNVAEMNYNKVFSKGSYLASIYVRYDEQPITDVAYPSLTDPIVLVNTTVNGRNSLRYGMEHSLKYTLFKNLDATLNGNLFYIYINGIVDPSQPEVTSKGYAYNVKGILSYRFPKQLTLQINSSYESPRIILIGATIPVYSMDVSINKMFGTKWIVNASLNDAFNTRRMGAHYETPFYIQDLSRRRETRFIRLSVTYIFGKMDASIFKKGKQLKNLGDNQGNQDGLDIGK